jgi:hypothetical protein
MTVAVMFRSQNAVFLLGDPALDLRVENRERHGAVP